MQTMLDSESWEKNNLKITIDMQFGRLNLGSKSKPFIFFGDQAEKIESYTNYMSRLLSFFDLSFLDWFSLFVLKLSIFLC